MFYNLNKSLFLLLSLSLATCIAYGQENDKKEIDVNFLFNYYTQDGDHAAVTGGKGTQDLQDRATEININIPLDSVSAIFFYSHLNVYTSASTDNIDSRVSSASREDVRASMEIGYNKEYNVNHQYSVSAGGSTETDYLSTFIKGGWSVSSMDHNREVGINASAYFDTWLPIFPEEIRGTNNAVITTNKRNSYSLSTAYSQVINKKLQASLLFDLVYQKGLLSTPFHRVYFAEEDLPKIEKLPDSRWKYPLGLRLNYYINDYLIGRFFYRYYSDDFGIEAHTADIEIPISITQFFTISPFYRFHSQTKANFFAAYQQHSSEQAYYTSDYDLSGFSSHKVGLGIYYSPLYGIGRMKLSKNKLSILKGMEIRAANYKRSDGMEAFLISLNCDIRILANKRQ
ncbi:DUF3570 domain-containing protein [Fulvivirga sediminis]|uniref:DUF3570 domain-containing protein n=1 Tax=Fulvivirga sediminis TaxID=2803949 RepID=A0A937FA96_9BACT|nr:DUF3570 domain-containing protein [Fulvivirga sediminis]MBL3658156.1 DUF3570 domain-containing protein [Fulvivirga sediminis]